MTTIPAIETSYAGCRFRSRLEARWAVLFDTAGIPWRYELEGYQLPTGWYLPDFFLPECGTWIEVKGVLGDTTIDRIEDAARHLPHIDHQPRCEQGPRLMVLGDIPEPPPTGDIGWPSFDHHRWSHAGFGLYRKNHRPWFLPCPTDTPQFDTIIDDTEPCVTDAYLTARRARFEHGERL